METTRAGITAEQPSPAPAGPGNRVAAAGPLAHPQGALPCYARAGQLGPSGHLGHGSLLFFSPAPLSPPGNEKEEPMRTTAIVMCQTQEQAPSSDPAQARTC